MVHVTLWKLFWFFTLVPLGLLRDALVLAISIPFFICPGLCVIVYRLFTAKPTDELYLSDPKNLWSFIKQVVLLLVSVSPFAWVLWGLRFVVIIVVNLRQLLPMHWQMWPTHWRVSYRGDERLPATPRAFFINGVAVDEHWLQVNCKTLEAFLGYRVEGIYNETNGILIDVIECFLQRNLNFYTGPVLNAAAAVEAALRSGNKVVLIGHSQGGIIVSLVIDHLMENYPALLAAGNLEVYTFASAADEFLSPAHPMVVKHYANMFDVVACLGILGCHLTCSIIRAILGPPYGEYYGQVFINPWTFGHLLSTFYVFQRPSVYKSLELEGGVGGDPAPF